METPKNDLIKRCELYLQRAPKFLQTIADSYDPKIHVFINWDIENLCCYGYSVIPDQNDEEKNIYAIVINPYSFVYGLESIKHRYKDLNVDLRDVVVYLLLHEIGHIENSKADIKNAEDETAAWEFAMKEFKKNKTKFQIPHRYRLSNTIDKSFDSSLLAELLKMCE